ncbi:hypothetical protein CRYO30217_02752 [Parvicella tangerina]|uniref:Uncharacterized protein n=2 Tax=Parvicella tangerina TaxID=2829795 RepID=A0A916JPR2_9FLAO|nr:hypothetical protein CRYO30217_02752 [Parvicella tangerina]
MEIRAMYLEDSVKHDNLSISVTRKDGRLEYAWVRVTCGEDTTFNLSMNAQHFFSIRLEEKFRGERIVVEVHPSNGKVKKEVIKEFDPDEEYLLNFSYSNKSFYRKIRGKF